MTKGSEPFGTWRYCNRKEWLSPFKKTGTGSIAVSVSTFEFAFCQNRRIY